MLTSDNYSIERAYKAASLNRTNQRKIKCMLGQGVLLTQTLVPTKCQRESNKKGKY